MITLHHLEHSRSLRIAWLLEELEVEYAVKSYRRVRGTGFAPVELRQVHPLGKSPVITDGDRVVAESGAIIEYILETHAPGRLQPQPGSEAHFRYRYWMHYAEGTLMPLVVMALVLERIDRSVWLIRPVAKIVTNGVRKAYLDSNIRLNVELIEDTLARQPWFAGDAFSACDIQMCIPLLALTSGLGQGLSMPGIRAWLERIRARPAYQRAMGRTGPLDPGLPA